MSLRVSLWIIFSWCAGCLSVAAQKLFVQEYSAEIYKGSSQNWKVAQDTRGCIYVANTDGILYYDGKEWSMIELADLGYPRAIVADNEGNVYVGLYGDFGYLQRDSTGKHHYQSLLPKVPEKDRSAMTEIVNIKVNKGVVYFSDAGHLYIYENGKVRVWNGENIGIVILDGLPYTVHEGNLHLYQNGVFKKVSFPVADVMFMGDYDSGRYAVVDHGQKLWLTEAKTGERQLFSKDLHKQLQNDVIHKFAVLSEGRVAILTNKQILILGRDGKTLFTVTNDMLQGNLWTEILFEDAQHNLWFSTDESVGMIVMSSPLSYFDKSNGIQGITFSQTLHNGNHYVGTDRGVYRRVEKEKFAFIPGTQGTVWNMYSREDILYVAHENGILEIRNGVTRRIIDANHVETLCSVKGHPNDFIMGTYLTGIWRVYKTANGWQKRKIKGFEHDEVRYMHTDPAGDIWIAHYSEGIWRLRLNDAVDSVVQREFYGAARGLPSDFDNRLYKLEDDESFVVASANGIYTYNKSENRFEPDQRFSQVLSGFLIYSLTGASKGNVYFRGRNVESKKEVAGVLSRQPDGRYRLLTTPFNKMIWTDNEPTMLATDDGVYITNHNKIFVYSATHKTHYEDPLQPYIRKVVAHDSLIYTVGQNTEGVTLPYKMNSVHFDFTLPYFENAERIEFQYKLQGFDTEWSRWTNLREASFTNLPEGDYTFMLHARSIYENESRLASFSFHINPPFYRTVWAYMLYIVCFGILLYVFSIFNTKRIQWQNQLLEKEVNEKTKELLAMNEEIRAQNEEISLINEEVNSKNIKIESQAQILKESNATKDKLFSIISHDLRGPVHQLREIFNLMESGYISADEFLKVLMPDLRERVGYVAALTDNLLHWAKDQMEGIQVKPAVFDLNEIVQENMNLFAAPANRKNVNLVNTASSQCEVFADKDMIRLVLRNLMSNAVKFTPSQGCIEVSAKLDHAYVIVSVRDTGVGLSTEEIEKILRKDYFTRYGTAGEKGSGLGLMLCREFVEKNKGTFTIESIHGSGSTFSFSVPLTSVTD